MSELTADSWITPLRVKSCGIKLSGPEKIVCEAQMDDVGGGVLWDGYMYWNRLLCWIYEWAVNFEQMFLVTDIVLPSCKLCAATTGLHDSGE